MREAMQTLLMYSDDVYFIAHDVPTVQATVQLIPAKSLGSIASRCSGKEPALVDHTRESGRNRAHTIVWENV